MASIFESSMALWQSFLGRASAEPENHDPDGATGSASQDGADKRARRLAPFPSGDAKDNESPPIFFL